MQIEKDLIKSQSVSGEKNTSGQMSFEQDQRDHETVGNLRQSLDQQNMIAGGGEFLTGEKSDTYLESGTEEKSDLHQHRLDGSTTQDPHDKDEVVEIKNQVQYTMLHESDVKVHDTDSSKANLVIKDRMAYDDDHTQNDQIISPSDGIQVQDGKFYQITKEIKSS